MYRYEIGKQVVCINCNDEGVWPDAAGMHIYNGGPRNGQILTIRDIIDHTATGYGLGLKFFEVQITSVHGNDMNFAAKFFRPVKNTDISDFTKILQKEKV